MTSFSRKGIISALNHNFLRQRGEAVHRNTCDTTEFFKMKNAGKIEVNQNFRMS